MTQIDYSGETRFDQRYSVVYLSDSLVASDDWNEIPGLDCVSLVDRASPGMSEATLRWRVGDFAVWFGEVNKIVNPLYMERVYCKIVILAPPVPGVETGPLPEPTVEYTWFGTIEANEFTNLIGSTSPINTDQILTAYGLMRDLEHTIVTTSVLEDLTSGGYTIPRGLAFNPSSRRNQLGLGNMSKSAVEMTGAGTTYLFRNESWDGDAATKPNRWDACSAVDYLLTHHSPKKALDGTTKTCTWELHNPGAPIETPISIVGWYDIVDVETDRRNLKEIIDDLVRRDHFAGWHVYGDDSGGSFVARVKIFSFADQDITLPTSGITSIIAANSDQVQLTLNDKHEVESLEILNNGLQRYDQIITEGERVTATFSAWYSDGAYLVKGWNDNDEVAYEDAASDELGYAGLTDDEKIRRNMACRSDDIFRDVYSRLVFDSTWHTDPFVPGTFYDVSNGDVEISSRNWWTHGSRVMDHLPQPQPEANSKETPFVLPFSVWRVETGDPDGIDTDVWQYGEQLNADQERAFSVTLEPLDDAFGIRLSVGMAGSQQMVAKSEFATDSAITPPLVDPADAENKALSLTDFICTIAVELDHRAQHTIDLSPPNFDAAKRIKRIYVPDSRYDYRVPGTITGIDVGGHLIVDSGLARGNEEVQNTIIRDDTSKLERIATAAAKWYSQIRQAIRLTYGKITLKIRPVVSPTERNLEPITLGTLITKVGTGISRPDVNCPVTSIGFNLDRQTVTIETTFYEGDFVS